MNYSFIFFMNFYNLMENHKKKEIISQTEYKTILNYIPATLTQSLVNCTIDINRLPQKIPLKTVALFSDISGFTNLSEKFMKKKRLGAECLPFVLIDIWNKLSVSSAQMGEIFINSLGML